MTTDPPTTGGHGRVVAGILAAATAVVALPLIGLVIVVVMMVSSIAIGPCEVDLTGPDRTDCQTSASPLVRAAVSKGRDPVERELDEGAKVDRADADGNRPLACAALAGNRQAVQALLEAGADPTLAGYAGGRPIIAAVSGEGRSGNEVAPMFSPIGSPDRMGIVRALVDAGADPAPALAPAVEKSLIPMVDTLLELGADPNGPADQPSPLVTAVWKGNRQLVAVLIRRGADPDRGGRVDSGDAVLALFLASPTSTTTTTTATTSGPTPSSASSSTRPRNGFNISSYIKDLPPAGDVPPIVAAALGRTDPRRAILTDLLEAGADPNRPAFGRFSALWVAAATGNLAAAEQLVNAGAVADPPGLEPATAVARARQDQAMLNVLRG